MPTHSELAKTKTGLKVANIVLQQLGAARFRAMTGAKNIVALENGIQFSLPRAKDGINKVVIKLNPQDTYDIEYWRIRGATFKKVKESKNIGIENLRATFTRDTGLATSLGTMGDKKPLGRKRGL